MADDRLLLACSKCDADQPIAILHGTGFRSFSDTETLQDFIEKHLACTGPHVLRFNGEPFVIRKEAL
tara:strand:- start:20886 stop:21086 length:201 start_codon:yes stop_codon:yes gene_type:complete